MMLPVASTRKSPPNGIFRALAYAFAAEPAAQLYTITDFNDRVALAVSETTIMTGEGGTKSAWVVLARTRVSSNAAWTQFHW